MSDQEPVPADRSVPEAPSPDPAAGATPPLPPMPEAGGWGQPMRSATPLPVPVPPKKRRWPLIAALTTGLVAIVVVVVLITSGGSNLPDSLGGVARVDSGPMAEVMEAFDDLEFMGITFDVAVYGDGLMPKYMVMAMDGDMPDSESLLTSLPSGVMSQNGATLDFDRAQTEQIGDTEYLCVPAEVDQAQTQPGFSGEMSMCIYQSPDRVAFVMDFEGADLTALMQVTEELHDSLT